MTNLDSFKAYDIRGRIPDEINDDLAYDIGRAYAAFVKPKKVAVGYDIRLSSPQLAKALKRAAKAAKPGTERPLDIRAKYLEHLLSYVKGAQLKKLKVVVNPGNGGAGLIIDALEPKLPFEFVKVNHKPDGTFPNGVPNPMLEENRAATADVVRRTGADVGLAWDGDYDRCFFFDETGQFIEGYYLVGLLAETLLRREPGARSG